MPGRWRSGIFFQARTEGVWHLLVGAQAPPAATKPIADEAMPDPAAPPTRLAPPCTGCPSSRFVSQGVLFGGTHGMIEDFSPRPEH